MPTVNLQSEQAENGEQGEQSELADAPTLAAGAVFCVGAPEPG